MNFFIRLKHYQLFLFLVGLAVIISVVDDPGPTRLKLISNLVCFAVYIGWLWSIASFLSSRLSQDAKILVATILITFFCFLSITISQFIKFEPGIQPPVFVYIIFFSLLFYSIAKIGSLLRLVEIASNMNYSKSFVYAILLFLFPLGVWVIQPKLNRLLVNR